jgi:hypothetical protein
MIKHFTFVFLIFSSHLFAQTKNQGLQVKHTSDFEITGDGSSASWGKIQWMPLVKRKGSSSYTTNIKTLYSDTGLYFLFDCEDTVINATRTQDFTDLFKEDVVEIFLRPDLGEPIYLEYELSPLNYELAILVPNFDEKLAGWQPWHYEGQRKTRHATKIFKDDNENVMHWTAEIFIPYSLLMPLRNVPPKKGMRWRANIYRIDYDNEISYWSWQPFKNNFHDFEMFGEIEFE